MTPAARAVVRLAKAGRTVKAIMKETGFDRDYCGAVLRTAGIKPRQESRPVNAQRRRRAAKRLGQRIHEALPAQTAESHFRPTVNMGAGGDIVLASPTIVGGISKNPGALIGHAVRHALTAPPIAPVTIRKADGTVEVQDALTFKRAHSRWPRRA